MVVLNLKEKNWKNDIKINKLSIEIHSKCNARCSYCSEMYYGGLNPKYDFTKFYEKLSDNKIFEEDVSITWGGGEPVLLKNFASLLKKYLIIVPTLLIKILEFIVTLLFITIHFINI